MSIGEQLRERVRERGKELRDHGGQRILELLGDAAPRGPERDSPEPRIVESISVNPFDRGDSAFGVVAKVDTEHASYVEEGTPPHMIFPKKPGGVLVFPSHGTLVFTRHVNHPGTQGTKFFSSTIERWSEVLAEG